jgi:hypothetical protein
MTRRVRTSIRYRNALASLTILAIVIAVGWHVHGWGRVSDFQRFRFGEAWRDDVNVEFGHNGCNTRDDILRRDLADLQVR